MQRSTARTAQVSKSFCMYVRSTSTKYLPSGRRHRPIPTLHVNPRGRGGPPSTIHFKFQVSHAGFVNCAATTSTQGLSHNLSILFHPLLFSSHLTPDRGLCTLYWRVKNTYLLLLRLPHTYSTLTSCALAFVIYSQHIDISTYRKNDAT